MSWVIRIDDIEMESDDFTIEDLGEVERVSDEPWSVANPLRSTKTARAFIAVALLRSGLTEDQAAARLEKVTLRDLKTAFDYKPEDVATDSGGAAPLARPARTSRGSSPGGRRRAGSHPTPDASGSATS